MDNQRIKEKLTAALADFEKAGRSHPGEWKVQEDEDGSRVFLVWSISDYEWKEMAEQDALYGDEPWTAWGGERICSGLPEPDESGVESIMVCDGEEIQQWAAWHVSADDDENKG